MADEFFVVYKDGANVRSKKGTSGEVTFTASTHEAVLVDVFANQMDLSRTTKQVVIVVGDYPATSQVPLPSNIIFEVRGIWTQDVGLSIGSMLTNSGTSNIEVVGGTYDYDFTNNAFSGHCLSFDGVDGLIVRGTSLLNAFDHGLNFDDCTDFLITENFGDNCGDDVITCHGSTSRGVIEKNNGGNGRGTGTPSSSFIEVEGESAAGIDNESPSQIIIRDNIGFNCRNGIQVTVDNESGAEFIQEDIIITGNIMFNNAVSGIVVQGAGTGAGNVRCISLSDNNCYDNVNGISVLGADNVTVTGGNNLNTNTGLGLNISNSNGVVAQSNTITGNGQGVEVASNCTDVTIDHNTLKGNTTRQAKIAGDGNSLTNNTISGTVGIQTLDLENGLIEGNRLRNITGNSVTISGTKFNSTRYRANRELTGNNGFPTEYTNTVAGTSPFGTDTLLTSLAAKWDNLGNKLTVTPESQLLDTDWGFTVSGSTVTITHNQANTFRFTIEASTENQV